ncbi:replication initiator protein A [Helcococcus ovis]|uniref:Replication initiator protein A n=1 Tax=Helcococcus ovis TaxID=72026 RepID=A0A4R9C2C9_9FIRM|nr:replication initiator protein A [Helcococcus ovis]TFF64384.1 replication initiator protein A [Helcococcus ovis]TFF67117.1 replication initiator protein A [Helcococcus ovis]
MEFDYFYNRDGDRFSYYMLPKVLVTDEMFKQLSSEAKILYSCLLERTSLSYRNKWIDDERRVYIIFTVEEIMRILNKSNKTAVKILNELDSSTGGIGFIERKRQGLGKPNIIYVKDFMSIFRSECKNYTSEVKNLHSRNEENTLQEVKKVQGSNPYNNNLEYSNPDYSFSENGLGTFQNVFLTEDEVIDLKEILLNNFENYIERLSTYIQSTGKSYKDHKATILSWFYKDQGNSRQKNKVTTYSLEDYETGEYL